MTCSSWKRAVVQLASTKVENDEHKGKKKMFNWFQMSSYWILGCEYFSWVPFQIFRYEHTWVNLCLFFYFFTHLVNNFQ